MKKTNKSPILKTLALAVNTALLATLTTTAHANDAKKPIGDLEIYKAAEGGSVTITMMLDISGSMQATDGICANPVRANSTSALGTKTYHLRDEAGNIITEVERADGSKIDTSRGVKLVHQGFGAVASDGKTYWYYCNEPTNRMEKLKQAVLDLVAQEGTLDNNLKLGLGTFPTSYNWYTGQIAIPAKPLTREQRWEIMRYISALFPLGSTPSAQAYVEAGAYMLGTTTSKLGAAKKEIITVGSMNMEGSGGNQALKLLYCASSSVFGKLGTHPTTGATQVQAVNNTFATFTHNGETYNWYSCNDATNRTFPPFDHNIRTQSSSWRATIIPDMVSGLDYNLLPEFDFVYGNSGTRTGAFPFTPMTNATAPKTADGWRNSYRQFADLGYHFGRVIEYRVPAINNSGFPLSSPKTKKPDGNTYQSPIVTKTGEVGCDGYGIYFLTDGEPNGANTDARLSANLSLGKDGGQYAGSSGEFPDSPTYGAQGYWNMIGAYAKDLREGNNHLKASIKTATVGFGAVFAPTGGTPTTTKTINGKTETVVDCDKLGTIDAKNLCRWGERGYGYGEGGFLATSDAKAVSESVVRFAASLNQTIPSSPSGVITVPDDPYSVSAQQAVAYLPMMEPKVSTNNAVWPGNLKKYQLRDGTVWGTNGQRLFKDTTGALNDNVQDEWSTSTSDNGTITTGGFYAQLVAPDSGTQNVRTVYIEDFTSATNQTPIMRKFGVGSDGKITLDDRGLSNSVNFNDAATYTPERVKFLLHFLGFTEFKPTASSPATDIKGIDSIDSTTVLADIVLQKPATAIRVLGASPHSAPTALSYGANLDDTGSVTGTSNGRDYVIFGSMDGALHMANANSGAERFAFIPKRMLTDDGKDGQINALKHDNTVATIAQPKFGVDAPWLVSATYDYSDPNDDGTPDEMRVTEDIYAYGGLRMGGDGLYALNLGRANDTVPTLAFVHTPSSAGFARLGQVWSRPTKAKILNNGTPTDVLIFGGGYDMCYENENFQVGVAGETYKIANDQNGVACTTKTGATSTAIGNAVYMINAQTGELIWSTSSTADTTAPSTASNTINDNIRHSIVGGVNTIDRNGDGYVDAIYFSDLGGQIFRADARSYTEGVPNRVVRLLAPADAGTKYVRRFYDKPVISVYREGNFNGGRRFVLVNATTGDRSNPISKMRELDGSGRAEKYADRVYGLIDTDIGARNAEFYGDSVTLNVQDVSDDDLVSLAGITGSDDAAITKAKNDRIAEVQAGRGWYYPLTYFDGYTNVRYSKGVGKSEVIGSLLFSSVYNPDKSYSATNSCSASVVGGSEYQMYCLPWGVCTNPESRNGHGGFLPAGQGISELTLGPTDNTAAGRNRRVLLSSVAFGDDTAVSGRIGYNTGVAGSTVATAQGLKEGENTTGGSGSMPEVYFDQRFVLQPLRWYDNSIKNN